MIANVARAAADRPAVTLITVFTLVVGALVVARNLDFDALPDVTPNQVVIITRAPGLTPEEVERRVTRPVETAVAGVPMLATTRSVSRYGISAVTAIFDDEMDLVVARQLVGERVQNLDLASGVGTPELGPPSGGLGEVFQFTLRSASRTPAELLELAELRVAPLLRQVRGVVEVNTWGGGIRTLEVVARPERLAAAGVSFRDLKDALNAATGAVAGSTVPTGATQSLLRGASQPASVDALAALPIFSHADDGAPGVLRVGDLALVREGVLPRTGAATRDGVGEVVYVMAQMLRGENALAVVDGIHAMMPDVTHALPDDVTLEIVYDRSDMVEATLGTVAKNLIEGGGLVVLVLLLLLGSVRAGLLVAAVIPLSLAFAAAGMVMFGIPGTLMSLGALDFGLLVDGAVVMVEGVFHEVALRKRRGEPVDRAALRGLLPQVMSSLARPVFFSVAIIVVVYVPILSMEGVDGKMFQPMALTVIFALLASLALALTAIPAATTWLLDASMVPAKRPFVVRIMDRLYAPTLAFAVSRPKSIAGFAIALTVVGGLLVARAGTTFVPVLDEGDLVIQTTRRADISLSGSVREAGQLEAALLARVPEVAQVASRIGSPAVATDVMGVEQADIFVGLHPRATWRAGLTKAGLIDEIDAVLTTHAPGGDPAFTQPVQMRFNEMVGGEVSDVSVSIYGDDLAELRTLAESATAIIARDAAVADVRIIAPPDVSLLEVVPRALDAARAGLSVTDVLDVTAAFEAGIDVGETWQGARRIPLRLKLDHAGEGALLERALIPVGQGLVTLDTVAFVQRSPSPSLVSHEDGARRIVVGFNVREEPLGDVAARVEETLQSALVLPRGVRMTVGGQVAVLTAAKARLGVVIPIVLLAIVILLALTFSSVRRAFIIFLHVPFASVGGVMALALRDMPISISAAVGFIALSGIAVLNGVVLMGEIARREELGDAPGDAAREAAAVRARPVLMTALVAAFGFVPMMLATGMGAEVQRPLATVVVGGLVTSTVLTLVVLPALYPWMARRRAQSETADTTA